MSARRYVLEGVAELADRPVDGRRVARVMAAIGLALAVSSGLGVEHLLASANEEADGGRMLRAVLDDPRPARGAPGRAAVLLVDGLREDEARALESWRRLAGGSTVGRLALSAPTLSRPFYHLLFTGVPASASGVRTNRFDRPARHRSVPDEVRARGGSVFFVSEGLDWMRRMHGAPADGGSDAPGALREPLDDAIATWRSAPPPSLLVVHEVAVDRTAHAVGIDGPEHRDALARADALLARLAAPGLPLVVVSDHGHVARGGHGGLEPEVASAPVLIRGAPPISVEGPIAPERIAPTLARLLGVPAPPTSVAPALGEAFGPVHERAASLVDAGRQASRLRLGVRRRWTLLLALVFIVMTLGPIKRAFGFDRSVAVAVAAWPALVLAGHLALGRPLSLSAIDTELVHTIRVAALGSLGAVVAVAIGYALGRGEARTRLRRAAASVGWSAAASALGSGAWVGFALGPWPLGPLELYLPLLLLGAAAAGLPVCAVTLAASTLAPRPRSSPDHSGAATSPSTSTGSS